MFSSTCTPTRSLFVCGGAGVGTVLRKALYQSKSMPTRVVGVTAPSHTSSLSSVHDHRQADLRDPSAVKGLFDDCGMCGHQPTALPPLPTTPIATHTDAIIHLAALPKPYEPWDSILGNNITVDGNVFSEAAASEKVSRSALQWDRQRFCHSITHTPHPSG